MTSTVVGRQRRSKPGKLLAMKGLGRLHRLLDMRTDGLYNHHRPRSYHDTKTRHERTDTVNKMFDYIQPFIPLFCVVVYLAIQSRWDACSRKKAYEELKLLNELRERSIIT